MDDNHQRVGELFKIALRRSGDLTEEQQSLLDRLMANCPEMIRVRAIALDFREALAGKDGTVLQQWIARVKHCEFGPLVRFNYGLQKDIAAVTAAVNSYWSNGQVEGQINRLKALNGQRYGRAGFQLLRARVLPYQSERAPQVANSP